MTALLVALGAAVGAPLRFVCASYLDGPYPRGTLLVNVAGSLVLGLCTALSVTGSAMALLGIGFCGALTTYSSFAVQTVGLGPRRGSAYAAGTVTLAVVAAAAGFLAGAQA